MYREDDLHKDRIVQIEKGWPMCGEHGLCIERLVCVFS